MIDKLKADLAVLLKPYVGQVQNGELEDKAQAAVDRYFKACYRKGEPIVLEAAGLQITGLELHFDIGYIGLKKFKTSFWPSDTNAVSRLCPDSVALGYVNKYQMYLARDKDHKYPIIVARYGMGKSYTTWCPQTQGLPNFNTVFFAALERAKQLGYLDYLREL